MAEPTGTAAERPPRYPTTPCKACHAPTIVWALTANADKICVDPQPATPPAGKPAVLLTDRGPGCPPTAEVVRNPTRLFGRRQVYRRHLDTCTHKAYFQAKARRRHA